MMSRLTAVAAVLAIAALPGAAAVAQPPDTTPPVGPTVNSTLPAGNVEGAGSVDVSFSSEPGATFECALDSDAIGVCDSLVSFAGLSEGHHSLTVIAVDASGNASDPTTVDWTEDYTAPDPPSIQSDRAAATSDTDATLTFLGEAGGSYACSLDGDTFAPCTSPVMYVGLSDGDHELQVAQTDAAGNVGGPASYGWQVDTSAPDAPALTPGVPALTDRTDATFAFSGEPGGSYECSLDGAALAACSSPVTYMGLTAGYYEIVVQQVDAAGNVGNPAIYDWQVDATAPPAPTIAPPPAAPSPPPTAPSPPPSAPKSATCVSRRTVTVHWRLPKGQHAGPPQVLIDGRLVATLKASARSALINLGGHPKAHVHVVIQARGTHGQRLRTARTYATCRPRTDRAPLRTLVLHGVP